MYTKNRKLLVLFFYVINIRIYNCFKLQFLQIVRIACSINETLKHYYLKKTSKYNFIFQDISIFL